MTLLYLVVAGPLGVAVYSMIRPIQSHQKVHYVVCCLLAVARGVLRAMTCCHVPTYEIYVELVVGRIKSSVSQSRSNDLQKTKHDCLRVVPHLMRKSVRVLRENII